MSGERRRRPDEPARRGWCPSLARPMPTGDGLLARVHPPLGLLSATQLRAVAEAARRFGNGHVDITARGNLQIRGVSEATAPALAASLAEAGLSDMRSDGGPQRLTLTSALAGFDPDERIDVAALAQAIEDVGLSVAGLPAKTLVAIDGGGRWGLGTAEADVIVTATGPGEVRIGLPSGHQIQWCAEVAIDDAPVVLQRVLQGFVATGRRRMRDLDGAERAKVMAAPRSRPASRATLPRRATTCTDPGRSPPLSFRPTHTLSLRCLRRRTSKGPLEPAALPGWPVEASAALRHLTVRVWVGRRIRSVETVALREESVPAGAPEPGRVALSDGLVAVVAEAPFGRCTADTLDAAAFEAGQDGVRMTPDRGVILLVPEARAEATRAALAAAGFITDPADPRRAVAACPGAPACASGTTPVPDHAAELADAFAPFAARGLTAHVSGCAKGCAHPRKAGLTLVAEDGRYRVVVDGAPGDGGHAPRLTFEAALDRVRRADPARSLAGIFGP